MQEHTDANVNLSYTSKPIEIDREIPEAKIGYLQGTEAREAVKGSNRGHASPLTEEILQTGVL